MDADNTVCPVCTLYLRPGITLKSHLSSHPKQKVIEALVRLSACAGADQPVKAAASSSWGEVTPPPPPPQPPSQSFGPLPATANHSFIYQQFMSTSSPPQASVLNVNPLAQQYVTIPTVFSPPMMCPPYVYHQQQQVIMSSSGLPPRACLPIEMSPESTGAATVITISDIEDIEKEEETPPEKTEQQDEPKTIADEDFEAKDDELIKEDDNELIGITVEQEEEDCNSSPRSDWSVRVRTDLSKACQTFGNSAAGSASGLSPPPQENTDIECIEETLYVETEAQAQQAEFYYEPAQQQEDEEEGEEFDDDEVEVESGCGQEAAGVFVANAAETAPSVVEAVEQINFVDVEEMQIMLSGDFMGAQLIAPVDNFDGGVQNAHQTELMTIGGGGGGGGGSGEFPIEDRSVSRESAGIANIRADERMPARGELSGQESNGGASDIAWTQVVASGSYDLMGRGGNWGGSDCDEDEDDHAPSSDEDVDHAHRDNSELNARFSPQMMVDMPTVVGFTEAPLNFKCSTCGEAFKCLLERQRHVKETHRGGASGASGEVGLNLIGVDIGRKKVKKLVVKPKKEEIDVVENNFDNVFTNKLKTEAAEATITTPTTTTTTTTNQTTIELQDDKKTTTLKLDLKHICSICDTVLPSRKALHHHKLTAHNVTTPPDARHKCPTCGENFPNDYKYTEHLRIHPLECRLCGKFFYRRQNLQLHMKRHLGIRPYKCEICEKSFLTKQKRDEHKNIHTGEAPIKCSLCDETFRRHSNLVQHRNLHHFNVKKKVKDFICVCGEIFHSKKKLAWHKEIHEAKPKSCAHCSEKFIHMASLTRHMRRAHNDRFVPKEERSTENVECPICKGVYLRSSLEVHIRNHSGQRPFTCLICNKDFTTKWNLKLHKWTHASRTAKPYRCDQCKGAFIRETDYVAHMNSHKSVKPYTCNYCGAQFIRKYNCQRHVREHEKGKSFACQMCGKSFHRSYYLKDHMRVHSGVRPFACHICGKTSTTKSNHNKHVRIHHAREPVSTEN